MKKPVFVTSLVILLLLTAASVAIGWLCYTASGLQFALMQLNHIPGVRLSVEGVQGKLAGPLSIDHISIDHERVAIDLDKVNIELTPAALIGGVISIDHLTVEKINVHVKPSHKKTPDHPIYLLPHFLRISAEQVVIQNASYQQDNKEIIGDAHLQGSVALSRKRLKINQLMLLTQQIDTRGDLVLQAGPVLTLNAALNAKYHLSSGVVFSGDLNISGSVTGLSPQLNMNAQLDQPQKASITSLLKWPDNQWNLQGDLSAEVLHLAAWWKRPAFSLKAVSIQFSVSKNGMRNVGQLVVPEFSSTPLKIDVQAFYADQVLTLHSAKVSAINIPTQISAQGTIDFQEKDAPIIDLQSRWTDLRWPLLSAKSIALITSAQGLFKISGQSTYQYELAGQISAPYWKDGLVSIRGKINPDLLTVSRYEASGSQGRLAGDASLQLDSLQEWRLGIEGNKLDASVIDARWPSDINIKATVQGRGFNRQAEFDVYKCSS